MRAFRLAYDGRPFHGFQRQPNVPTVEDALFDALRDLGVLDAGADTPEGYAAAGRTDAGASAVAQMVAFDCPDWCRPRALNAELPAGVRAWAAVDVPADFHATHDAREREYTYHLHAPPDVVADERAGTALDCLAGRHDFHNLTPDDEGAVRNLAAGMDRDGDYLVLTFRAGGFPRQFVRRAVSLVRAVGAGDSSLSTVDDVLGPAELDGPDGIPPAPASPLVLTDVAYDVAFAVDEQAARSAREVFEARRVEHETLSRVAGEVVDGVGERNPDGDASNVGHPR